MRVRSKRVLAVSMALFMVFNLAAGLVRPQAASAAPYDITEYPTLTPDSSPYMIASGPDDRLWFAQYATNQIASIDTSGQMTEYAIPTPNSSTQYIAAGTDGTVWFVERSTDILGRLQPNLNGGEFTEYPVTDIGADCGGIVVAPNGHPWFVHGPTDQISTFDPNTEVVTSYTIPTGSSCPIGLTFDANGDLWFMQSNNDLAGHLDTSTGIITEYPIPTTGGFPALPALGPDGNIWFSQSGVNQVAMIDPNTGIVTEYPLNTPNSEPYGVTAGSDGGVWFTGSSANYIGRIDPSTGDISEYSIPTANSFPFGVTTGSDGNIWFTQAAVNQIGMLELPPQGATDASITKTLLNQGEINVGDTVSYEVVVTNTGETTLSGAFDATDYFPGWLNYESVDLPGGSCQAYQPGDPNILPILETFLPNHLEYGGVQCGGIPAPIAPQASTSFQLNFVAVAEPGQDNYIAFGLQDVNEDDGGINGLLVGGEPGDDLIDNWEASSPRHNNMAVARYVAPASSEDRPGVLAESGTPLVGATVTAAAGLSAVLITRRRHTTYARR
jgi:uncharacterized repeat protein (TIGR01451 family)